MKKLFLAILLSFSLAGPVVASNPHSGTTVPTYEHSTGNHNAAVFLINFIDDTSQPASVSYVQSELFDSSTSLTAYFQDTSYGKLNLTGTVLGWFTVNYTKEPCLYGSWESDAHQQAINQGIDLSGYDFTVYAWLNSSCGFSGIAQVGGNIASINGVYPSGPSERNVAHELGHSFGVGHANTRVCYDANGVQVQASTNCSDFEYQDPYDVMGNSSFFTMDATHRAALGWLPVENTQVITSNTNLGTYHISPLEWNTSQIQQLQIKIPKQGNKTFPDYCLEIRQSYGWDQFNENSPNGIPWGVNGIMIRQQGQVGGCISTAYSIGTFLMDATPTYNPYPGAEKFDKTLAIDQTFLDSNERISIKTLAIDSNGATVQVTYLKR